jgi:hypothetical protein
MHKPSARWVRVPYSGPLMHRLGNTVWRLTRYSVTSSGRDRQTLEAGIAFLAKVQEGANILHGNAGLVPNIDSISAYTSAVQGLGLPKRRALYSAPIPGDVFGEYRELLIKLRNGELLDDADSRVAAEAQIFFDRLGDLAFTATASPDPDADQDEWVGIVAVSAL